VEGPADHLSGIGGSLTRASGLHCFSFLWRCLGLFIKLTANGLGIEHVSDVLDTEFREHTFRIHFEKQEYDLKFFCVLKYLFDI
jgi:hypothetical protein